jgi:hypothetical protein
MPVLVGFCQLSLISTGLFEALPALTSRVERYAECSRLHRRGGGSSFQGSCDFSDFEFFLRKVPRSMNFRCSPGTRFRNHGGPLAMIRRLIDIARR